MYKAKPKLIKQFEYCDKEENQIPFMVIIGSDEVARGECRIKEMSLQTDDPNLKMGALVKRSELIAQLKARLE
jgi:histidyl-tRNA synthetase